MDFVAEFNNLFVRWVQADSEIDDYTHLKSILEALEAATYSLRSALGEDYELEDFTRFVPWEVQS